jgi:hypothetical protein
MTLKRLTTPDRRGEFVRQCAGNGGDWKAAGQLVGYSTSYSERLWQRERQAIARAAVSAFGAHLPFATKRLVDLMRSTNERVALNAVRDFLDRCGVVAHVPQADDEIRTLSDEQLRNILVQALEKLPEPDIPESKTSTTAGDELIGPGSAFPDHLFGVKNPSPEKTEG